MDDRGKNFADEWDTDHRQIMAFFDFNMLFGDDKYFGSSRQNLINIAHQLIQTTVVCQGDDHGHGFI